VDQETLIGLDGWAECSFLTEIFSNAHASCGLSVCTKSSLCMHKFIHEISGLRCYWSQYIKRVEKLMSFEHCRAISRSNCYHKNGHDSPCHFPDLTYMIIYGVIQVILCQIPNFHKLWGLSILAAIMSFTYATLGFGLGLAKVIGIVLSYSLHYFNHYPHWFLTAAMKFQYLIRFPCIVLVLLTYIFKCKYFMCFMASLTC
jgi:hypothetical protein